ncbi:twin-arginine translocation pathway signal sequence domain protein, putative [Pseudooceanicola batsensis HTCC2597]|uniref:Twin-arginine translocation pathway signal sequence domain protein, putative n=1 Tax=Pseudooceanicola batsensis (strain ATCC BAA-863 / DSM 15984 / KCTC 12145 / HTCC2597) TaxID=252305 RepID=A3U448_PSEBH|nr:twin-arginine translocation pathway signal sequence domain protein, putative [Pseudooceanicola batsensis HTCC2597]
MALAALAGLALTAACGNGIGNSNGPKIDARVDATLGHLYQKYPESREVAAKSVATLVMPVITEAGFGLGGSYGQGALRIDGVTVDYYSATAANVGLQIGAQQYAHVLFFMTQDSLERFRRNEGWAAGADVEYAFSNDGLNVRTDTNSGLSPVVAYVFAQAGARFGATLEGLKYTRIIP